MNDPRVISVNPGVKTLGELSTGFQPGIARISRCLSAPGTRNVSILKQSVNLLFGINRNIGTQVSGKLLFLRVLAACAVLLGIAGNMASAFSTPSAFLPILLGSSVALGLLTRPVALCGVIFYGFATATSFTAGAPDVSAASLTVLSAAVCVLGPGMFSADQILRRSIFRSMARVKKSRAARKNKGNNLRYDAYTRIERRLV